VRLEVQPSTPRARPVVVVVVRGEVDLGSAEHVRSRLDEAMALGPTVVDLSGCTFLDSSVIACLLAARREQGVLEVVVPSAPGAVERTLAITGLTAVLGCHHSLDGAIAATPASSDGDRA
jgi:anti-sigma B factor antagonist